MEACNMIVVNGVKMSLKDYRKQIKLRKEEKEKKAGKKKKKAQPNELVLLSTEIKEMTKKIRLIKSLSAYYNNAYRQWGTIANDILEKKEIKSPFLHFRLKVCGMIETLDTIMKIAKKGDRSVFQFFEKLSYQLDDVQICIDKLCSGIVKSNVLELYKEHECINGCTRRLGLKALVARSFSATKDLKIIIEKCRKISNGNSEPLHYSIGDKTNFISYFC